MYTFLTNFYWITIKFLFGLFCVPYWVRTEHYNKTFDKEIDRLIAAGTKFTNIRNYTAKFDYMELWIENHPSGSFTYYGDRKRVVKHHGIVSRYNVYRLNKILKESRKV